MAGKTGAESALAISKPHHHKFQTKRFRQLVQKFAYMKKANFCRKDSGA
jgi:hypothetical protein